jgi:hypothetical protein
LKTVVVLAVPTMVGAAPLTRDEAVALALERNASLLSIREEVAVARARVEGSSRLLRSNPEVEGSLGPRRAPGEAESSDLGVSVTQELEIFGQRGARLDAARSLLAAAEARVEARRVEIAAEARTAFAHLLAAEERVRIAEESRALATQELEAAEQRLRSGATSRIEVNESAPGMCAASYSSGGRTSSRVTSPLRSLRRRASSSRGSRSAFSVRKSRVIFETSARRVSATFRSARRRSATERSASRYVTKSPCFVVSTSPAVRRTWRCADVFARLMSATRPRASTVRGPWASSSTSSMRWGLARAFATRPNCS